MTFLVTRKVIQGGTPVDVNGDGLDDRESIFAEFIGVNQNGLAGDVRLDIDDACNIESFSVPSDVPSPFAPVRVVLFKDPVSGDA